MGLPVSTTYPSFSGVDERLLTSLPNTHYLPVRYCTVPIVTHFESAYMHPFSVPVHEAHSTFKIHNKPMCIFNTVHRIVSVA